MDDVHDYWWCGVCACVRAEKACQGNVCVTQFPAPLWAWCARASKLLGLIKLYDDGVLDDLCLSKEQKILLFDFYNKRISWVIRLKCGAREYFSAQKKKANLPLLQPTNWWFIIFHIGILHLKGYSAEVEKGCCYSAKNWYGI